VSALISESVPGRDTGAVGTPEYDEISRSRIAGNHQREVTEVNNTRKKTVEGQGFAATIPFAQLPAACLHTTAGKAD
tara:strand:- start:288 stop:518 length:231 start_codon:yes stop_codon:yes gene_type:complete